MGVLHETWIRERKTEWSIWMLYSKVEMPHQYTNSKGDETSQRTAKRAVSLWKLPDDVSACVFLPSFFEYHAI